VLRTGNRALQIDMYLLIRPVSRERSLKIAGVEIVWISHYVKCLQCQDR